MTGRERKLAYALILFFAWLPFTNALLGPFIWDDHVFILKNPHVTTKTNWIQYFLDAQTLSAEPTYNTRIYRPIRTLLFGKIYEAQGDDPFLFHFLLIALHALTSLAIPGLLATLRLPWSVCFFSGLVFAAHPVHTEAVSWISSLSDSFSALLIIITLRLALSNRRKLFLVSLPLYVISLFTKESAAVVPILFTLMSLHLGQSIRRALSYSVITLAFIFLRFHVLGQFAQETFNAKEVIESIVEAPFLSLRYFWRALNPFGLNAFYGDQNYSHLVTYLSGFVYLPIFVRIGVLLRRKEIPQGFELFLWLFTFSLLPILNILPLWVEFAERFVYLPSLFAYAAIGMLMLPWLKKYFWSISISLCLVFSVLTFQRNQVWSDELNLWEATAKASPNNASVFWNLGLTYVDHGEFPKALEAFERGRGVPKSKIAIAVQIAQVHLRLGDVDSAIHEVTAAETYAKDSDEHSKVKTILGIAYLQKGEERLALQSFNDAINASGSNDLSHFYRGRLYAKRKKNLAARNDFIAALSINPNNQAAKRELEMLSQTHEPTNR